MTLYFSAKKFICPICQAGFTRKERCKHHVLSIHFNIKFQCRNCKKLFISENGMLRHRDRCEGTTRHSFICQLPAEEDRNKKTKKKLCLEAFPSSENLFIHKCKVHWKCKGWYCPREVCSGRFYAKKDYLTHVGTENRDPTCHFSRGPNATPLKRYRCKACGRRFKTRGSFYRHADLFCRDHNNDIYPEFEDSRPNDPPQ